MLGYSEPSLASMTEQHQLGQASSETCLSELQSMQAAKLLWLTLHGTRGIFPTGCLLLNSHQDRLSTSTVMPVTSCPGPVDDLIITLHQPRLVPLLLLTCQWELLRNHDP